MIAVASIGSIRAKESETIPYMDCLALSLLPLLMNLAAVPMIPMQRSIVLLFLGGLLFKNVVLYPTHSRYFAHRANQSFADVFSRQNVALWALMLLLLLFTIADVRGGLLGLNPVLSYFSVFLRLFLLLFYLLSIVALNRSDRARRALIISVSVGLGLFVVANIAGYFSGLRGALEDVGQNKMLSLLGLSMARAALPFAAGVNNFGAIAGLSLVVGFALVRYSRMVGIALVGLGLAGVVLADSRASLLVALVTCLAIVFMRRLAPLLRWLPVVVFIMPLVLYGANSALMNTSAQKLISRDGFGQKLGSLTGRDVVWKAAINTLADPHPIHLVGYGASGQITSGTTKGYSWIFAEPAWASRHSLHNTALQVTIDIGYIGLILWLVLWWQLMSNISARWRVGGGIETSVLTGIAVFIALGGIMEASGSPAYPDVFAMLMLLVAWTLPRVDLGRRGIDSI